MTSQTGNELDRLMKEGQLRCSRSERKTLSNIMNNSASLSVAGRSVSACSSVFIFISICTIAPLSCLILPYNVTSAVTCSTHAVYNNIYTLDIITLCLLHVGIYKREYLFFYFNSFFYADIVWPLSGRVLIDDDVSINQCEVINSMDYVWLGDLGPDGSCNEAFCWSFVFSLCELHMNC